MDFLFPASILAALVAVSYLLFNMVNRTCPRCQTRNWRGFSETFRCENCGVTYRHGPKSRY